MGNKSGNGSGNRSGNTTENGAGKRAFARKPATESEIAAARVEASRILGLHALATPPSVIAKLVRLPIAAIEVIIQEGSPTVPSSAAPPGATAATPPPSAPTAPKTVPESPATRSTGDDLADVLGSGRPSRTDTKKLLDVLADDQLAEVQAEYAKSKLELMRLEIAERRARLERGAPGDGGPDRSGVFDQFKKDEEDELRREYMRSRILAIKSGGGAPGGEIEKLRLENEMLRSEMRDRRLIDQLDARLSPMAEKLKKLEERQPPSRTLSDVEVSAADKKAQIAAKASDEAIVLASERLRDAPKVLAHVDRLISMVESTPLLEKSIQGRVAEAIAKTAPDMLVEGVMPADEAESARLLRGFAAEGQAVVEAARPRLYIPRPPPEPGSGSNASGTTGGAS